MDKKKLTKEMMGELVNTFIVAFFGFCVVIGWFKDVFLRSIDLMGWYGNVAVTVWSIFTLLISLLGIVSMLVTVASSVLDFVFKFKDKESTLYKYIQGGSAALAFVVMVFGLKAINFFINISLGDSVFSGNSWFSAGSLVWVITIISVMKVVYLFMFKENKEETVKEEESLPPIEE